PIGGMNRPISTFDEHRERAEQTGDEWQFGSVPTDLAAVPLTARMTYLPAGVLQFNNLMDTDGCASRGPLNILETKLDYFYDHGSFAGSQSTMSKCPSHSSRERPLKIPLMLLSERMGR